ncbi:MAG TPA: hypothetical protein VFY21_14430 [Xanthobacteraceae bacterium]|nr:hypothetical protein [Xanthobacteraceae bacterium]
MKKFLIAGAAVAAFAVTPALAQQAIVPGDSQQARSQVSQTAPTYQPTYRGGYVANYGGGYAMGYAPQGYVASGPYAAVGAPYAFMAPGIDGAYNPGVSDQERSQYAQFAPTIGWPGDPQRAW